MSWSIWKERDAELMLTAAFVPNKDLPGRYASPAIVAGEND
jgi:hypothetical protein